MRISSDDPNARLLVECIQSGKTADLEGTLAGNPALAQSVILDAKGQGRTLLHIATDWPGHFPHVAKVIAILVAAGADPNIGFLPSDDAQGHHETPLHWAASANDIVAMEALLEGGADIEAPGAIFTGGAPMSDAVIFAQWNAARFLLERGAQTTFIQAAALGLLARVQQIYARDSPSRDDLTMALWHACRGGDSPTVQFLVERGANLNWIGWDHQTPRDAAQQSGHTELADWLQSQGARTATEIDPSAPA